MRKTFIVALFNSNSEEKDFDLFKEYWVYLTFFQNLQSIDPFFSFILFLFLTRGTELREANAHVNLLFNPYFISTLHALRIFSEKN